LFSPRVAIRHAVCAGGALYRLRSDSLLRCARRGYEKGERGSCTPRFGCAEQRWPITPRTVEDVADQVMRLGHTATYRGPVRACQNVAARHVVGPRRGVKTKRPLEKQAPKSFFGVFVGKFTDYRRSEKTTDGAKTQIGRVIWQPGRIKSPGARGVRHPLYERGIAATPGARGVRQPLYERGIAATPGAAAPAPFTKGGFQMRSSVKSAMAVLFVVLVACRIGSGVSGSHPSSRCIFTRKSWKNQKKKPHRSGASSTSLLWSEADQKIAADFNEFRIHKSVLLALRKLSRVGRSLSASCRTCDSYRPGFVSMNQRTKSENRGRSDFALPCQREPMFLSRVD